MRAGCLVFRIHILANLAAAAVIFFRPVYSSFSGEVRDRYLKQQADYAHVFSSGGTNVPLFAMDWFEPTVHFCRINLSGKGSARRDVGHAIQAGVSIALDNTNLFALVQLINELPPGTSRSLSVEREIVVGCIRTNSWFQAMYDRAEVPPVLESIASLTHASLPWYIPPAEGHCVARSENAGFIAVATAASIALVSGERYVQLLDFGRSPPQMSSPLNLFYGRLLVAEYEHPAVIAPDGRMFAVANNESLYSIDSHKNALQWKAGPLEHEGYYGKHLITGDGGKTLFAAGAHKIERWDFVSGSNHAVLVDNPPTAAGIVRFLNTSRDGKVLLAGFGLLGNQRPAAFAVWNTTNDTPALEFTEKEGADANLSPDGEWISLSQFANESLILFRWRTGERKEVQLRNSRWTYSVRWTPDQKKLAAHVDTYPSSVIVYDTTSWKPIAQWNCGRIGERSEFILNPQGVLYQVREHEINALNISALKSVASD
jgi:hypothetical protein